MAIIGEMYFEIRNFDRMRVRQDYTSPSPERHIVEQSKAIRKPSISPRIRRIADQIRKRQGEKTA